LSHFGALNLDKKGLISKKRYSGKVSGELSGALLGEKLEGELERMFMIVIVDRQRGMHTQRVMVELK
jgi:hypothetical protein